MLDSFLGLSFGSTGPSPQFADSHRSGLSPSVSPSSHSPGIVRSALKRFVTQFFSADGQEIQAQPNNFPSHLAIQPERRDEYESESLLQAEQERTRQLTQELLTVRSALKQMNDLQADLAVERETGKQLVKFLEEAEQEARKVPVLEQLLRQRIDTDSTIGKYEACNLPITRHTET